MLIELYYRLGRKIASLAGDKNALVRWNNRLANSKAMRELKAMFKESAHPMMYIEISTSCNYKCSFCPQSIVGRPEAYMSRESFGRIIDELKVIDFSNYVVLNVNNEPFLHPDLIYFCKQIERELPRARLSFNTNGSLMSREDFDYLASLQQKPLIVVNDYRPNHVIADKVEEWVLESGCDDGRFMIVRRGNDEKLSNSAGNHPGAGSNLNDYESIVCTWPFRSLFVADDLRVFLCCMDYQHEVILGNLKDQHLMDIWLGEACRDVRSKMLENQRKGLQLCCKCDVEEFYVPPYQ